MEEKRLKFYDDIFKPYTKKKKRKIITENKELVSKTIKLLKQNKKSLHHLDDSFLRTTVHGMIRFTDWLLSNYYEILWNDITFYNSYIYKEPNGELIRPGYITDHFRNYVMKKYNLKKIRFHDLRHTCATILRREGVAIGDIHKWLGHSQITTTENLYANFEYQMHLRSANSITNALKNG